MRSRGVCARGGGGEGIARGALEGPEAGAAVGVAEADDPSPGGNVVPAGTIMILRAPEAMFDRRMV